VPNEKTYKIGRFELILPFDHKLDEYQSKFRLYDSILGEIAGFVIAKYPEATVIDIGANVGDSAAVICRKQDVPILCIEGSPFFLSFLRRNLLRLPPCIEVVDCLVGSRSGLVPGQDFKPERGTASLKSTPGETNAIRQLPIRPLAAILREHERFQQPRLIKSDTDGSDFEILLSSLDVISDLCPVLYFEYDPTFRKNGIKASVETISALEAIGYKQFFVYDNFGHLMDIINGDATRRFTQLSRYIMSHLMFGRQIYYLDVCAFSSTDGDLAEKLYIYHRDSADANIREAGWEI
jgi:FkbM family methyltransferase